MVAQKVCYKCKEIKSLNDFYVHKGMLDKHLNQCKTCSKKASKLLYQNIPAERRRSYRNAYNAANKNKKKAWAASYLKNNRGSCNALTALRRAAKLQATPKWLTDEHKKQIKEFYTTAKDLQWLSDPTDKLEVDHIVPLRGKIVSGLHVPWNLQILPKSSNVAKSNKDF